MRRNKRFAKTKPRSSRKTSGTKVAAGKKRSDHLSGADANHTTVAQSKPHPNSKQAEVIGMLRRPQGATISAIMKITHWQPHSIRGFFAGVVRKKLGLTLKTEKPDAGQRTYRIIAAKPDKPRSTADKSNPRVA